MTDKVSSGGTTPFPSYTGWMGRRVEEGKSSFVRADFDRGSQNSTTPLPSSPKESRPCRGLTSTTLTPSMSSVCIRIGCMYRPSSRFSRKTSGPVHPTRASAEGE